MTEKYEKTVVNDVATRKKYVKPEIEVIELEPRPALLGASGTYNTTFQSIDEDDL
ncbi:MAG: hypothetical protein J6T60_05135 [Bacteroidales bacterium]|nr:hypothetical protein [Bacteroidales bacterium]